MYISSLKVMCGTLVMARDRWASKTSKLRLEVPNAVWVLLIACVGRERKGCARKRALGPGEVGGGI